MSSITFNSKFESGNLNYVIKITNRYYLLFLQYDSNSIGHTQWFYFKATGIVKGFNVRFDILNMVFVLYIFSVNLILCILKE